MHIPFNVYASFLYSVAHAVRVHLKIEAPREGSHVWNMCQDQSLSWCHVQVTLKKKKGERKVEIFGKNNKLKGTSCTS